MPHSIPKGLNREHILKALTDLDAQKMSEHPVDRNLLIIVPCGQKKIWDKTPDAGPTPAKDAYTGSPFKVNRKFAEHFGGTWMILSAKYVFASAGAVVLLSTILLICGRARWRYLLLILPSIPMLINGLQRLALEDD